MFQPGTYKDGSLGTATQPGSYQDGSLGILSQPGAFRDGTLGAVAVPLPGSGSQALFDPRRSSAAARASGIAAARAAAADAARVAATRSRVASYSAAPLHGLGFATSDVPFWGWLAGGVVLGAAVVYSLKK